MQSMTKLSLPPILETKVKKSERNKIIFAYLTIITLVFVIDNDQLDGRYQRNDGRGGGVFRTLDFPSG